MPEDKKDDKKKKHKLSREVKLMLVLITFTLTFWAMGFHGPWIVALIALLGWVIILYPFLSD